MSKDYINVLSLNDSKIALLVFKKEYDDLVLLYEKNNDINKDIIFNGFIKDPVEVIKLIKQMLQDASEELDANLKSLVVSIDIDKISIQDFQSERIKVPGGILDDNIWRNEILKKVNITQESSKHILDISIFEWIINGKSHFSLDNQYQVNFVDVKGYMYQINRVQYEQYTKMFQALNLEFKLIPLAMNYTSITRSSRVKNYEMFVNLNNQGLVVSITQGNHLIISTYEKELSLSNFITCLANDTNIDRNKTSEYLNYFIPIFMESAKDVKIAQSYSDKYSKIETITSKDLNSYIAKYAKEIAVFIEKSVKYLKDKNDIDISNVTFLPTSDITKIIFNSTKANLTVNSKILTFEQYDLSPNYNQACLHAKAIINDINNNMYDLSSKHPKSKTKLMGTRKE